MRPRVRALAVTAERTWVDGVEHPSVFGVPAGELLPTPVSLVELVDRASKAAGDAAGVVLVVAGEAATRLVGLPPALGVASDAPEAVLEGLSAAGWQASKRLSYWTSFWASRKPSVYVCVTAYQGTKPRRDEDPGDYAPWLIDAGDLAGTTRRLAAWETLTGAGYRTSPGVSGVACLQSGRRWNRSPYWLPDWDRLKGRGGAEGPLAMGEQDLRWQVECDPELWPWRYDQNTAYLAAAAMAEVAPDMLQRTGATWDNRMSGYWLITAPAWNHPQMPSPVAKLPLTKAGRLWVCTPTLRLLDELAEAGECGPATLHDSWTAPARRTLRPWAERIRDAIAGLDPEDPDTPIMRSTLKASFREGIGMMGRHRGFTSVHRPDWRHTIVSEARSSLWKRMWQVGRAEGRWPLRVHADEVTYGSRDPNPVTACPRGIQLRPGLGGFHLDEDTVAEIRAARAGVPV